MTNVRVSLFPLLFLVLTTAACGEKGPSGSSSSTNAAGVSPRRALFNKAVAAFPQQDIAACTTPVGKPLRLVLRGKGGTGTPESCGSTGFGEEEAWFSYRDGAGDWQEKKVEETTKLVLFQMKSEQLPKVAGTVLVPGIIEGRAVVFDDQGAPTCQVAIRAEGPSRAWTSNSEGNKDAKRGLCVELSLEVTKRLASPGAATAAAPEASASAGAGSAAPASSAAPSAK
ncbi:hypothetical protein [Polyangium jinanense]|uniref:Lipoprotein n=1 Tax=Polyangium jinanense TaxID=2829994 RepID=A0A9X3XIY0_9BACT|nr:hypothetical protein [Polyangium jinanense]MDC3962245.1 hypothetical protein [Polyangium jinanense]MDC3988936.1 hypothetical protein [Polyangium jinanense]